MYSIWFAMHMWTYTYDFLYGRLPKNCVAPISQTTCAVGGQCNFVWLVLSQDLDEWKARIRQICASKKTKRVQFTETVQNCVSPVHCFCISKKMVSVQSLSTSNLHTLSFTYTHNNETKPPNENVDKIVSRAWACWCERSHAPERQPFDIYKIKNAQRYHIFTHPYVLYGI